MYRKKYLIVISENFGLEHIINIFEDISDFAKYYNMTYVCAKTSIYRHFIGYCKDFQKNYRIEFVEELKDEVL